jgi:hypothetical protein
MTRRRWPFPGERDETATFPFFYSPLDSAACRSDYAADLAKACKIAQAAAKLDGDFDLVGKLANLRPPATFRRLAGEPRDLIDRLVDVFYRRHLARIALKNRAPGRWGRAIGSAICARLAGS